MLYLKWLIAAYILGQGGLITALASRNKVTPGVRIILNLILLLHFAVAALVVWFAS